MWLKPSAVLIFLNPSTEVNGNLMGTLFS